MKHSIRGLLVCVFGLCAASPAVAGLPLPNAWRISDVSSLSGSTYMYYQDFSGATRIAATNVGFRMTVEARFVTTFGDTRTMMVIYGLGSKRFLVAWETNSAGNLVAHLEGGPILTLTTNGAGSSSYHTHELVYNRTNGSVSYIVDGVVKTNNWMPSNNAWPDGRISWGAGFSGGQGEMNFNRVWFDITNVLGLRYNAGTEDNPTNAPAPFSASWLNDPGSDVNVGAVSPDTAVRSSAFSLAPTGVTTSSLVANGQSRPGSWPTRAWIEWGTNLTYSSTGVVQLLTGFTNTQLNLPLNSLAPGLEYNYRTVSSNLYGIVYGADYAFNLNFRPVATDLPDVQSGSLAWADYDRDGWMDVLVMGATSSTCLAQLWRNTGSSFVHIPIPGVPGLTQGSVTWADYNNDEFPDFLLTGQDCAGFNYTQLWRNTGSTFALVSIPNLPSLRESAAAWGDFNDDGRVDFLLAGATSGGGKVSQLFANTGNPAAPFTNVIMPNVQGVEGGSLAWVDFDTDADLDFMLTGLASTGKVSQLWRNTGTGFTNLPVPGLAQIDSGSASWADYDNDLKPEFLLVGAQQSLLIAQLWRNTGSGFTNVPLNKLGFGEGAVAWADYDCNGRPDVLIPGLRPTQDVPAQVWRNVAAGLQPANPAALRYLLFNASGWADYDNDGRIDFLISGYNPNTAARVTELWRNYFPQSNAPPSAPPGLSVTPSANRAILNWSPAADEHTPAAGLTYNVRVGTSPGASDVLSSLSRANGSRLVPQGGNAGQRLSKSVPVQLGQTYYWSVQAVDGGFAGSPFAPEQSFTMNTVLTPPGGVPVSGDVNGNGIVDLNELNGVLENYNGGVIDQAALDDILERYWADSPWLQMTNVAGLGATNVSFTLSNSLVGQFTVEYSTNLFDWEILGAATPRHEFTDTNAPALPQRFYRLRWP